MTWNKKPEDYSDQVDRIQDSRKRQVKIDKDKEAFYNSGGSKELLEVAKSRQVIESLRPKYKKIMRGIANTKTSVDKRIKLKEYE